MIEEHVPEALVGQTLGKKFHVRRVIGVGGMGVVFEVEHALTKRVGALKLLQPRFAKIEHVVERFVREASAAGHIGNPHIVESFDAGELASGEPYLFMELLPGSPLSSLIRKRGRLPFSLARELVLQAADGLSAAHAAEIVHRDIKSENLFVCDGERPFVKILDFGISKFAASTTGDRRLTIEGAPLGTPHYMSPEQVVGKHEIDQRTDIYSLGVVLYECLAGKVPFDADSLPALGVKIFEGKYEKLSELGLDVPNALDGVLARALTSDLSERYPDMGTFRDALARISDRSDFGATEPLAQAPASAPSISAAIGDALGDIEAPVPAKLEERRFGLRGAVLVAAVASAALGVWFLSRPSGEPKPAPPVVAASAKSSERPQPLSEAALIAPPPSDPTDAGSSSGNSASPARANEFVGPVPAASSAKPRRALPRAEKTQNVPLPTPAAEDGLSETNPFAPQSR